MLNTKKIINGLLLAQLAFLLSIPQSQAANWLMLQGTEKGGAAPRAKVWGFIQAQYQEDYSKPNAGGAYVPPKLIGSQLTSQKQFNVNRARIGVRGVGMPLDPTINYFALMEIGTNATTPKGSGARISDASITINRIPGARIRMGLFKTPGAEEGLQAIHVFDYINFTSVTNQLLLERTPNSSYSANAAATKTPDDGSLSAFNNPVSAFRDVGLQLFDSFNVAGWDHSYALMMGNGNGLNQGDNDSNMDTYSYWSSEKIFSGQGPRAKGLKFFAWNQAGKRLLDNSNDTTHNPISFERTRSGLGAKYSNGPHRVSMEYMTAKGMIFVGPDKPTFDINGAGAGGDGTNAKATGYYIDYGYAIPDTNLQVDLRYDALNRLEGDKFEFNFKTTTLGLNYFFNKKSRLTVNYETRTINVPNFGAGAGPNANLDGVGNRLAMQLTHIF